MKGLKKENQNIDNKNPLNKGEKELKTQVLVAFFISIFSIFLFISFVIREKASLDHIKYGFMPRKYNVLLGDKNATLINISGSKFLSLLSNAVIKKNKNVKENFSFAIESIGSQNAISKFCISNNNKVPDILIISKKLNKDERQACLKKGILKKYGLFRKISLVPLSSKKNNISNISYSKIKDSFYKKNNVFLLDNEYSIMFFKKKFIIPLCKKKLNATAINKDNLKELNTCVNNFDLSSMLIKENMIKDLIKTNNKAIILLPDQSISKFSDSLKTIKVNNLNYENSKYYLSYKLYFYLFDKKDEKVLLKSAKNLSLSALSF